MTNKTERTPQDAEAVAQAREALVRVLQAAHISCEPSTFYDLAETLGVTFPPTEHQIADALFAAVRVEGARDALTRFVKERREGTASDDQWDMLCDLERFRDREYPAPAERERYTEGIVLKRTQPSGIVLTPPTPQDAEAVARETLADLRQHAINGWVAYGYHQMSRQKAEAMLQDYEAALTEAVERRVLAEMSR